jgi:hypothetical protein
VVPILVGKTARTAEEHPLRGGGSDRRKRLIDSDITLASGWNDACTIPRHAAGPPGRDIGPKRR